MAKYLVQKSGPLHGEVMISGSKNAVLPIMAAALLSDQACELTEVPALRDVEVMCKLLESVGTKIELNLSDGQLKIFTKAIYTNTAP